MLGSLLGETRIQLLHHVDGDWRDAIAAAARPLLSDGAIESSYIDAMVSAVETLGPYIVLDDGFALPHAQRGVGVNRLGMSLLRVEEPVDLLGNPVYIFLVLAAVDHDSHLDALAELSHIWDDPARVETLRRGDADALAALFREVESAHSQENPM